MKQIQKTKVKAQRNVKSKIAEEATDFTKGIFKGLKFVGSTTSSGFDALNTNYAQTTKAKVKKSTKAESTSNLPGWNW